MEWGGKREEKKKKDKQWLIINSDPVKSSGVYFNQIHWTLVWGLAIDWHEQGRALTHPSPLYLSLTLLSRSLQAFPEDSAIFLILPQWSVQQGLWNWGLELSLGKRGEAPPSSVVPLCTHPSHLTRWSSIAESMTLYDGLGAKLWDRVRKWPVSMAGFIH